MNGLDLDLSGLEGGFSELLKTSAPQVADVATGTPIEFNLDEIEEDPDQPRQAFDEKALAELAESIKADKVRVPVSVKPKNERGKYTINHGARRYRASLLAGKTTIPGFIDVSHDDFAQVVENIQRDNLTALEIARFIEKRRTAGDKDKFIAERLGKSKSYISMHGALLTWPLYIEEVYKAGLCSDVATLYNLIQLNKKAPVEVEKLCQGGEAIARRDVTTLEGKVAQLAASAQAIDTSVSGGGEGGAKEVLPSTGDTPNVVAPAIPVESSAASAGLPDEVLKKPILQVTYEGHLAYLELKKRAGYGRGWIKIHSTGEEKEVPLLAVAIQAIVEG
jgi:ParB family chromosome partitioning protein